MSRVSGKKSAFNIYSFCCESRTGIYVVLHRQYFYNYERVTDWGCIRTSLNFSVVYHTLAIQDEEFDELRCHFLQYGERSKLKPVAK